MNQIIEENGWVTTPLEALTDFVIGGDWGEDPVEKLSGDFVKVSCIRGGEYKNWRSEKGLRAAVRQIKKSSLEKRELRDGDILLEISGGGPDQPVGRTVIIDKEALEITPDMPKICSNFIRLVRLVEDVDKRFVQYFLQQFYISGEVIKYQGGSNNLRNLKFKEYINIDIPFAPLNEQKRVANKLDALFKHWDIINDRMDNIPLLLKQFKEKVLKQAVSGHLTKGWRENNKCDAHQEVINIKLQRESHYQEQLFISQKNGTKKPRKREFEEHNEKSLIDTWSRIFVEEIFDVETGSTPKRDNDNYWLNGKIPWIKSGQVVNEDIFEADEYITETALKETNAKLYPVNSVLIALYGEGKTRGQVGILKFEATSNQAVAAMVNPFLHPVTIKYVFYFGLSQYQEIRKEASGGNQPNLNIGKIKKWKLDFPPLKEQEEIVKRVDNLFLTVDTIEKRYRELKSKIEMLPKNILDKAFKGQLVEQDENDEPATTLLDRIMKSKNIKVK